MRINSYVYFLVIPFVLARGKELLSFCILFCIDFAMLVGGGVDGKRSAKSNAESLAQ